MKVTLKHAVYFLFISIVLSAVAMPVAAEEHLKLSPPTNLEWSGDYGIPGTASVSADIPNDCWVTLIFHRADNQSWLYKSQSIKPPFIDGFDLLWRDEIDSGRYYYEAYCEGISDKYEESTHVTSEIWTYEKPNVYLPCCTNMQWNGIEACFLPPYEQEFYTGIEIKCFYSKDGSKEQIIECVGGGYSSHYHNNYWSHLISDSILETHGMGYYFFKIRALSSDITQICHSQWSDFSPAQFLSQEDVNNLLGKNMSIESMDNEPLTETAELAPTEPAPTEINLQEPGKRNGGVLFILALMFLGNIGGLVHYFKSKKENGSK